MIMRFFAGVFGSAPIVNVGGVMADMFGPKTIGIAVVVYSLSIVGGPTLGPLIGGAIVTNPNMGWRWTEYIVAIFAFIVTAVGVIFIDESYVPVLLARKARRLRLETKNWALHAKSEEIPLTLKDIVQTQLARPILMLVKEPIALLIAIYSSFVYALVYLTFEAFPIVFQEIRGWNSVVGGLPFIGLLIGIVVAGLINVGNQKYYLRRMLQNGGRAVPEARLPPMMLGSVIFCIGLFWFAWTSNVNISWVANIFPTILIGWGFLGIFQNALNYLIDTYRLYAASAIASNTFVRSFFAAGFPMFASAMFHNLGVSWASSVLAFLALAMIPIPFVFFYYGERIRGWSSYINSTSN